MADDSGRQLAQALRTALDPSTVDVFAKLKYKPNARQAVFHAATEYDVIYGGARGSGKSKALLMEALRQCVHHPGLRVLGLRKSFPELKSTLVKELAAVGFAKRLGCSWNATEMELRFPNGSLLRLGYVDSLADTARYQGTEWGLLCIDELTLLLPEVLPILKETLRSGDGGKSVIGIRATCNPGGPSHTLVKVNYVEATSYGADVVTDEDGRQRRYVPAKVYDNLEHVGADYLKTLEGIPDVARRKAMLDGDWSSFGGQCFEEFRRDRHIVPRWEPAKSWRRTAGIDFGYAAPFACIWLATDQDGRVWIYREAYGRQIPPEEQARMILAAEAGEEVAHYVDPATNAQATGGLSVYQIYAQQGLGCTPANNDRLAGWQTVHRYLAEAPICQYHAFLRDKGEWSGDTCPKLHIFADAAPNLVRTLPDLSYDAHRVEDVDSRLEDHVADALRYALHSEGSTAGPVFYGAFAETRRRPDPNAYSVPVPPSLTVARSPFVDAAIADLDWPAA